MEQPIPPAVSPAALAEAQRRILRMFTKQPHRSPSYRDVLLASPSRSVFATYTKWITDPPPLDREIVSAIFGTGAALESRAYLKNNEYVTTLTDTSAGRSITHTTPVFPALRYR